MGTPEFAVPSLRAVARACDVVAVVTQPDRPKGRGLALAPSPVAAEAAVLGLATVLKPDTLKTPGTWAPIAALAPDLLAVVAFGMILPQGLLEVPRAGAINLHASLLPDYRGASPIQRALWDGRAWTGLTTMFMDEGLDTGDMIQQRLVAVDPADDAAALSRRLADEGAPLLAASLVLAHEGRAPRVPQGAATGAHARKLKKEDGVIDWTLDALAVWNRARAVTPWPGAVSALRGRRVQVVRAWPEHVMPVATAPGTVLEARADGVVVACGTGALRLVRVRPEGRSEQDAADWARGARLAAGDRLEMEKETIA
jgi:methionyl-tRNA formyltransferase